MVSLKTLTPLKMDILLSYDVAIETESPKFGFNRMMFVNFLNLDGGRIIEA
jgi:hypothetical protein